ncbi:MAG TPA: Asp-tRNA(Asn)/Glu-tRNA(Gln) amidotransferase GatCAB subunit B [Gammaproteobacteria bacterium]|nr:Asp-tRNA(Asn)/Glu-tRNA(Gln) amidotransferase GatCAB subunit B [Gammaproteobacteria bacterium]|tara:strand:- start:1409 stop:2842 length:1434 start_codon:yes stop_codon:yes gene_type:complete
MSWEAVIGLEIHVQLATQSKIFSGASTTYGASPNAQACNIDLGLPGVLPVLNERAVELAVRFGLAIGAQINQYSIFDRKNYFYADLPKGYQISQFETPIVGEGTITITPENGRSRTIGITRAHLEEDAGKSVHDLYPGMTAVDLNRTGTPLLEIVSEPDMRSAQEASAYFRQIHTLARYVGICDGNLAEGSMRCDANVSVRPSGQAEFGERTEIKNINSFRFVEQAIEHEIARQIDVLEAGGKIERETRLYDPDKDETRSMRSKELSNDYRYFPDPDLLPLSISEAFIERIRGELPELPDARQERYASTLGLSVADAVAISSDIDRADYFDACLAAGADAKQSANWMMGELSAYLNKHNVSISQSPIAPALLAQLIARIDDGTLSSKTAKTLFDALWGAEPAGNVDELIETLNLAQLSDDGALTKIVDDLIAANPKQFDELRSGKEKMLGFFVGQVMKATQGKANPQQVNQIIRNKL